MQAACSLLGGPRNVKKLVTFLRDDQSTTLVPVSRMPSGCGFLHVEETPQPDGMRLTQPVVSGRLVNRNIVCIIPVAWPSEGAGFCVLQ